MTSLPTHLAFAAPRSPARANPTPMLSGIGYGSGGVAGSLLPIRREIGSVRAT